MTYPHPMDDKTGFDVGRPLYLIEYDHGPTGFSFTDIADRIAVVREISEGYHHGKTFGISRVLEILPDNTWADITVEVAREVRDSIMRDPHAEYDWQMADWLHKHLGVGAIRWPRAAE
jgi:hypothetical protein